MKDRKQLRVLPIFILLLVIAQCFIIPLSAFAQYISVGGEWLISISGKEKGTALLEFGDPPSGISTNTGEGFIAGMGQAFFVKEDPAQQLIIQSNGNIVGDIGIVDSEGVDLGTFSIDHGKADKDFEELSLKGTFTEPEGSPRKVTLTGIRIPDPPPELEGTTYTANVSGGGLKSKVLYLNIINTVEDEEEEGEGYPFLSMMGSGSVKIDGVETPSVDILSDFIINDKNQVFGNFYSSVLGSGELQGTLRPGGKGPKVKFEVIIYDPESLEPTRKFKISAVLNPLVGAKLAVIPSTNPVDFGTTPVGAPINQTFTLTNVGGASLSGTATIEGTDAGEFSILSGSSYGTAPTKSKDVAVRFNAQNQGTFDAQIRFTGSEEGDVIINITATANP